jgi:peptidoglycan/xylan/chitin deacetylase (PgdA/CDA1 family)
MKNISEKKRTGCHRIEKLIQVGLITALILMLCSMCFADRHRYRYSVPYGNPGASFRAKALTEIEATSAVTTNIINNMYLCDTASEFVEQDGSYAATDSFSVDIDPVIGKVRWNLTDAVTGDNEGQPLRFFTNAAAQDVDISAYDTVELTYYIPEMVGEDITTHKALVKMLLYLYSTTGNYNWTTGGGFVGNNVPASYAFSFLKAGWHTARFSINAGTDSSFLNQHLASVGVMIYIRKDDASYVDPDAAYYITFSKMRFVKQTDTPQWFISFDDGISDAYDASLLLDAADLKGTFFIEGNKIGTTGYLTLAQCREMQAKGHLIANHSWSIDNQNTAAYTEAEIIADVRLMQQWMCANGFSKGSRIYAVPGGTPDGSHNDAIAQMATYNGMLADMLDIVRQTMPDADYPIYGKVGWSSRYRDPGLVFCTTYTSQDATTIAAAVTAAVSESRLGGIYIHGIGIPGSAVYVKLQANIADVAAKVAAGTIRCITLDELVNKPSEIPRHQYDYRR